MVLTQCPNVPYLFQGIIIPYKPPVYLGQYVEDFIFFFLESDEVEKYFETVTTT